MDNLKYLTQEELKVTEGGLIIADPNNAFFRLGVLIFEVAAGAYYSGYDSAQNNCECQNQ